ncbi:MAG: histidine kinase dimerization/phospho-acceptor domain-containing protein, partial [Bdellovibrionota bacterium]
MNLLYQQNITGLITLSVYAGSYLYLQGQQGVTSFLIWWGSVLYGSALIRVYATYRWSKIRNKITSMNQLRWYLLMMSTLLLISGICWGVAGWYIPATQPMPVQLITAMVVIFMSLGGAAAYSATWFAPYAVFLSGIAPWAVASFISDIPEHQFIGGMILLYALVIVFGIRNWCTYVQHSLRLNVEHAVLSEQLAEQIRLQKEQEILLREKNEHEAASKAKSVFLANVSHEIRTPLSAINGFADLLLQNEKLDPDARRDLQMILRNGKYLVSLVTDLLDLSKIETGQIYVEKNKVSPMSEFNDVVELFRPLIESRNLKLDIECINEIPEFITSDATRLREVLINLLNNAAKYTLSGCIRVLVSFEATSVDEGFLKIRVVDTGIGISPEAQK